MIVTDHEKLRQKSVEVKEQSEVDEIVERLKEDNMRAWTEGCGLAAIQIGISKRVGWVSYGSGLILINPEIVKGLNMVYQLEGCLSIPNKKTLVGRYNNILIKNGFDREKLFAAEGFLARVIQHEIDHMNGILNIDKEYRPKKLGRNDPCQCGSGKKYKQCCLKRG